MTNDAVETIGLFRRFGNVMAVRDLNLHVSPGHIYGFLGPNGAGKTTTIRMLVGLIRPDRGEVRIFGLPLARQRPAALKMIGALVELPSLYPHLTGWENVEVTRRLVNAHPRHIDRVLNIVGLAADARRLVRGYSLGMRQRLSLALALLREPQLLILDEPTNGLDPAGIHEMRDLIRRLPVEHGITVFLSSHLLSEVEQTATDIGIINAGRLCFQGSLIELQAQWPEQILLEVNQPPEAYRLLSEAGWSVVAAPNGQLSVNDYTEAKAAQINAQLVTAGLEVFSLCHTQPTLEQMFLTYTQDAGVESRLS